MRPEIVSSWEEQAPVGYECELIFTDGVVRNLMPLSYNEEYLTGAVYNEVTRLHNLVFQRYDQINGLVAWQSLEEEFAFDVRYVPYSEFAEGMSRDTRSWEEVYGWMISTVDSEFPTHEFVPAKYVHRGLACKRKQTDLSTHGFVWVVKPHHTVLAWAEGNNASNPFR